MRVYVTDRSLVKRFQLRNSQCRELRRVPTTYFKGSSVENVLFGVVVMLLILLYTVAIVAVKEHNKYLVLEDKFEGRGYSLLAAQNKNKKLESQLSAQAKRIEILERTVTEYKAKIAKVSNYFKK